MGDRAGVDPKNYAQGERKKKYHNFAPRNILCFVLKCQCATRPHPLTRCLTRRARAARQLAKPPDDTAMQALGQGAPRDRVHQGTMLGQWRDDGGIVAGMCRTIAGP